jgi:hypothetical protein
MLAAYCTTYCHLEHRYLVRLVAIEVTMVVLQIQIVHYVCLVATALEAAMHR